MAGVCSAADRSLASPGGDGRLGAGAASVGDGVRLDGLWTPRRAALLLIVVAGLLYAQTLSYPFVYEDLRDPDTLFRPWSWPGWHRLLTILSERVSIGLSGMEPWGWHLVSVGLHLVNGALIWSLVAGWAGVFAVGLYLLHPLNVEAVAYVSARSDLLLTTCVLLALVAADRRFWVGVVVAGGLAVLAKESGVVALPLVLAWSVFRQRVLPAWLYLVPLPAVTLVAWMFRSSWTLDPLYSAAEFVKASWLLTRIVLPAQLSIDHDWAWITPELGLMSIGAVLIGITTMVFARAQRTAFVASWIGLALAPRLVMPLVEGLHEHHFILPMAGLALGIGACLQKDTDVWV